MRKARLHRSVRALLQKEKSEKKRNVPSRFYPGLGLLTKIMGSAYGSRTRDLRLERAASLATRRMRLNFAPDYIITRCRVLVNSVLSL